MQRLTVPFSWPRAEFGCVNIQDPSSDILFDAEMDTVNDMMRLWGKLRCKYRVVPTPGDGFCGLHALRMVVAHACTTENLAPPPSVEEIYDFILSPEYWDLIFQGEPIRRDDFQFPDYTYDEWFHYRQMDICALWLGKKCGTHFRLVWVIQKEAGSEYHMLVPGHLTPRGDGHEHVLFIYWSPDSGGHFQAIIPQSDAQSFDDQLRASDELMNQAKERAEQRENEAENRKRKYHRRGERAPKEMARRLVRGPALLWYSGWLKQNPFTGNHGPGPDGTISKPVLNGELYALLFPHRILTSGGLITKAIVKAKGDLTDKNKVVCTEWKKEQTHANLMDRRISTKMGRKGSLFFEDALKSNLTHWRNYHSLGPHLTHEEAMERMNSPGHDIVVQAPEIGQSPPFPPLQVQPWTIIPWDMRSDEDSLLAATSPYPRCLNPPTGVDLRNDTAPTEVSITPVADTENVASARAQPRDDLPFMPRKRRPYQSSTKEDRNSENDNQH